MERTPIKIPLPCYGLEYNRTDPTCQQCPHSKGCLVYMGSRADKVPVDRVQFDIVPKEFVKNRYDMHDPELPHLQRLYTDCYSTVFHLNPTDNVQQYKKEIAANALKANCSLRLFMLANMVAHQLHDGLVIKNTQRQRSARFTVKQLAGELSLKRAAMYQEMCQERYGVFSLSSLAVLVDSDNKDTLEDTMLRSEVTAANWLVRFRIFNSQPLEVPMYDSIEQQLAPEWLAIEQSYMTHILKPHIESGRRATPVLERHRYSVWQTHQYYKKRVSEQRIVWLARQAIFPEAVRQVCATFSLHADDLLHPRVYTLDPVENPNKSPLDYWRTLALAIRHYHCWLYLGGAPSYFTPRRNAVLTRGSLVTE